MFIARCALYIVRGAFHMYIAPVAVLGESSLVSLCEAAPCLFFCQHIAECPYFDFSLKRVIFEPKTVNPVRKPTLCLVGGRNRKSVPRFPN